MKTPLPAPLQEAGETEREAREAAALATAFAGSCEADRERLAKIVDLLPCYVVLLDKEYRIRFHNKAFEQYFGAPEGQPCYAALRKEKEPCRFCPPLEAVRSKGASVMEWVHPTSRHAFRVYSYPFTEADGSPCVLKAGFNITASLRVQQALDLSEQSYRAITDNLSIGIALVDTQLHIKTGNIRLSKWFAEGFRLDRRICGLLRCGEQYERADRDSGFVCPECPFQVCLKGGESYEQELAVAFQDGKERILRLVTCPVKTGKTRGKHRPMVRALIVMLEDITNRLRVNKQLQHARKLEAMSTLAGGIAHEINQPLSALHLYASGLQMLLEKDEPLAQGTLKERLSFIMHEAERIRSIISHMRALVMQEGQVALEGVALLPTVNAVLDIMRHQIAARGIAVEVEIPADLPLVHSNTLQLEQVLVNLVGNAVHALDSETPEPGEQQAGTILIRAFVQRESERVRLEVADSGPGLPANEEQIFDPFYTTKERHEGMGLGLSIVHGLASMWGAEISVARKHKELGGAVFFIDLHQAGKAPGAGGGKEERNALPDGIVPSGALEPEERPGANPATAPGNGAQANGKEKE